MASRIIKPISFHLQHAICQHIIKGTATVDIPFSVKTFKFAANSLSKFAGHFIESLSMELKLSPAVEAMVLPATGCLLFRGGTATTEDVVAEQSYAYLFPLCN
nr:hypothetical protein Iba_chr09cCG11980 [Ipomoea batatas]